MRVVFTLVHIGIYLARSTLQSPTSEKDLHDSSSSTKSLFDLIDQRVARGASRISTEQFRKDFAFHPKIKNINLLESNHKKIIEEIASLRQPIHSYNNKAWNQKYTLAIYHLLKNTKDIDSRILEDLKTSNHKRKKPRLNDEDIRTRQRVHESKYRAKKRTQRDQGSVLDKPMSRHLGKAQEKFESVGEVIKKANEFRPLYSTGPSFHSAVRAYLLASKYDQKDVRLALDSRGQKDQLKSMKENSARKRRLAIQNRLSSQEHGQIVPRIEAEPLISMSSSSKRHQLPVNEEDPASKKARIKKHLSNTDWWKTHHL